VGETGPWPVLSLFESKMLMGFESQCTVSLYALEASPLPDSRFLLSIEQQVSVPDLQKEWTAVADPPPSVRRWNARSLGVRIPAL
jgi:hypothetical protein